MLKIIQNRLPHVRMVGLALLVVPGMALAEVSYVRELSPAPGSSPGHATIVSLVQAPVNTSDPLYDPEAANTQWIYSRKHFQPFDIRTGVVGDAWTLPAGLQVAEESSATLTGVGTTAPLLRVLGRRNTLYTYSMASGWFVGDPVIIPVGWATSLAAQGSHLNVISDEKGYSINPETGALTEIFHTQAQTDVEMGLGEFSTDTLFQAYGANGLLYVLDYGNNRIQMLDPEDNFAAIDEFDLQTGAANFQFAIGSTGNVYLGDGLGGGSYYDWDGDYLGTFTLPGAVGTPPLEGSASYLSTDQNGGVYVIDSTGFHQYLDAGVVPEPSAMGLLVGAAALLVAAHRRYRLRG